MHQALYDRLIQVARQKQTICYSEVAPLVGLDMALPEDRTKLGELLGDISRHEHAEGRPLLSALVIQKDTREPGIGFYNLGRELKLTKPSEERFIFFARELQRVHQTWST